MVLSSPFLIAMDFKEIGMKNVKMRIATILKSKKTKVIALLVLAVYNGYAQSGNAGIEAANAEVRGYFASGTQLMYAIGAILGLIGAVKVYQKWNAGDPDTSKVASAWFGSCVFLVIVATVIRSFFGV